MSIVSKPWGTTECLVKSPMCEQHRIVVQPGGYCSVHRHHGKANVFYVTRGILEVRVWFGGGAAARKVLLPGDCFTVEPGLRHQFFSPRGATALETEYPVLRGEDIERETKGGVSPSDT